MTPKADRAQQREARERELEAKLARAERTVQALREVGLALGSTLDLDQLLELILRKITELLDAERATLYLLDEQKQRLLSRIVIGDKTQSIELPVGEGIAGHAAKIGRAVRVKDAYRDKRFSREWDELTGYRTRSILAAPMKNHVGRIIGIIQVLNKHGPEEEFSQHDEELLSALATQAAVSIDNSRLFLSVIQKNMQLVETKELLEHRVSDLKLLFELESAMGRAATMEELARAVVLEASRACAARTGALLVDEEDSGVALYVVAQSPLPSVEAAGDSLFPPPESEALVLHEVKRIALKRSEGIFGLATSASDAPDIQRAVVENAIKRIGELLELSISSVTAVPLEGEDDMPLGALILLNSKRASGFSQDDRALLRLISANASTAVRLFRSRLQREKTERLTSIGRLLSGVMHDMRTPLTVISGYVQLMASTNDAAAREEFAHVVLKQFDILSAMQREVLEFARGERSILVRKVYLLKFFGDIEKQLQQEVQGTNIHVVLEVEDRGVARFDEAKMIRVMHNLIRNAIEAMTPQGGTLTVRAAREKNDLVITVSDTGRGIPKEIESRLFQSFVTAGKKGGTGLGLAIVKKIVDEHGGSIRVESSDKGAVFRICIPQDSAKATIMPPPPDSEGDRGRGRGPQLS